MLLLRQTVVTIPQTSTSPSFCIGHNLLLLPYTCSTYRHFPVGLILVNENQLAYGTWYWYQVPGVFSIVYLMIGNIGPIAKFYVKMGNLRNIFYMMGYSELKLTFKLDE
jgi:hypothetical protein